MIIYFFYKNNKDQIAYWVSKFYFFHRPNRLFGLHLFCTFSWKYLVPGRNRECSRTKQEVPVRNRTETKYFLWKQLVLGRNRGFSRPKQEVPNRNRAETEDVEKVGVQPKQGQTEETGEPGRNRGKKQIFI